MIRKAAPGDASRIAEILIFAKRTAYRSIFQNDVVSFQEMQVLDLALHYRDDPGALHDIYVFDDGIVKGMMRWQKHRGSDSDRSWELKELYIDPFFQGYGIGHQMILYFLTAAWENHIPDVSLWVLEKNQTAIRFYQSHGFCPNGIKKLEEGTVESLLQYVRTL